MTVIAFAINSFPLEVLIPISAQWTIFVGGTSCPPKRAHTQAPPRFRLYTFDCNSVSPIAINTPNRFTAILGERYPTWREARAELNELPLTAEVWKG
jgi:hypothetical protein